MYQLFVIFLPAEVALLQQWQSIRCCIGLCMHSNILLQVEVALV